MNRILIFSFLLFTAVSALAGEMSVSVTISAKEIKPGDKVSVNVEYSIPPEMHQSYNEDFFYFTVEGIPGMVQGEIKYPEGLLDGGETVYSGITVLSCCLYFPDELPPGQYVLRVVAWYQLCSSDGSCFMPCNKEILQVVELDNQHGSFQL